MGAGGGNATEQPSRDSTLPPRAPKEETEQKKLEAGGCVAPWGIHLPNFLELSLDAVVHAAPEPDENVSAPAQGG